MAKSKLEQSIEDDEKALKAEQDAATPEAEEEIEETVETVETKGEEDEKANRSDDAGDEPEEVEEDAKPGQGDEGEKEKEAVGEGQLGTGGSGVLETEAAPKNEDWARIRRENARLKAQAAAASAKPAEAPKVQQAAPVDPEPDKSVDMDSWRDWKIRQQDRKLAEVENWTTRQRQQQEEAQTYQQAGQELNGYIENFKKIAPDTQAVLDHAAARLKQSFKDINPDMSDLEVNAAFGKYVLQHAGSALKRGEDPAEALYQMALDRFGRPAAAKKEVETQAKPKVDLKRVDASRRKSATPLVGGGQGSENTALTKAGVASMSLAEFAQVDPKTLAMLEGEAD